MYILEVGVAKQTGHGCGVKRAGAHPFIQYAAIWALLAAVAGCASTWSNPSKSIEEAAADEKLCASEAEEIALARAARQKVDYGRVPGNAMPGLNRGETPMQLQERSRTENTYAREFESCMRSKGFSQNGTKSP